MVVNYPILCCHCAYGVTNGIAPVYTYTTLFFQYQLYNHIPPLGIIVTVMVKSTALHHTVGYHGKTLLLKDDGSIIHCLPVLRPLCAVIPVPGSK